MNKNHVDSFYSDPKCYYYKILQDNVSADWLALKLQQINWLN
ncbi:hypothetical protein [Dasania marina]